MADTEDIITINVGGTLFTTRFSTLASLPDTRLGSLTTKSEEYIAEKNYFFFDRNPDLFQCFLDLYRYGSLHVPGNVCGATLKRELEYWQIPPNKIPFCCLAILCKYEDDLDSMERLKTAFASDQDQSVAVQGSNSTLLCKLRRVIWLFLTSRNSSLPAKVFNAFYYLMASLSVFIFILETHPTFRDPYDELAWLNTNGTVPNNTKDNIDDTSERIFAETNPKKIMFFTTYLKIFLQRTDQVCLMFFTAELLVRLLTCPSFWKFFISVLNILDIIIIVALLIAFGLEHHPFEIVSSDRVFWVYVVCKSMVILRIVRLFRLTRDVGGLKVLMLAVKSTIKQLLLLGASVFITVVLFSSVMYYVEFEEGGSSFSNIPITIWWSLITVTTVGYGDVTPSTYIGYIIACFCAVFGILLVAMPITIVASTFSELSFLNRVRERQEEIESNVKIDSPCKRQPGMINKVHVVNHK